MSKQLQEFKALVQQTAVDRTIKPCPFCGDTCIKLNGEIFYAGLMVYAQCMACKSKGPELLADHGETNHAFLMKAAKDQWNRRASKASERDIVYDLS